MKLIRRWTSLIAIPSLMVVLAGTSGVTGQTVLLEAGSSWNYWHQAQPAPPGWNEPGFPANWPGGLAKFGFGDDGEVTVLSDSGTPTTYFRRVIFVEAPQRFTNLLGRIVADDGAVVYLNGVDVGRINLYPGPVAHDTLAANDLGPPAETNWVNFVPRGGQLIEGPNVVAVEVHQASPFSRDLGFDFSLLANVENLRPTLQIEQPAAGDVLSAGANVRVRARVTDVGNQVSNLVFQIDGEIRYVTGPNLPDFTWADVPPGVHTLKVHTTLVDGTTVHSPELAVTVSPPAGYVLLVPNGAIWKYLDTGIDPGSAWRGTDYPDAEWKSGPAELGYGDDGIERRPERTLVGFGPSPGNKHITTYFRHAFEVLDASRLRPLNLRLLRDDGAVVYLNGVEIARSNLPPGPLAPGTFALQSAPDDGTVYEEFTVPSDLLLPGRNVVAVEVHQSSPESSDLSFDLMLLAASAPPHFVVQPSSLVVPYCIDVTLHAEATGSPQYQWFKNGVPIPGAIQPSLVLPGVERDVAGIYVAVASNEAGTAESDPAEIQVCLTKRGGLLVGVMATTNLGALFAREAGLGSGGGAAGGKAAALPPQVQLSHGVPLYFTTENGSSNPLVPFICQVPAAHTKWVGYFSSLGQRLHVSTEGSDFDTVLGVYTNSGGLNPTLVEVTCDRGNAAQSRGVVEFNADRKFYYIAVDGEQGATGTVRLKIGLGVLQQPFYEAGTDVFHFEVAVRSNLLNVVRSTTDLGAGRTAGFAAWTFHGQFVTNRDWVFPQAVSNASRFTGRYFGGREQ